MYSAPIDRLIDSLKKLPAVGQKAAERFVFHWLTSGKKEVTELKESLTDLLTKIKSCEVCWNFSDESPCHICNDTNRDQAIICVVAETPDVVAIEKTGEYKGMYHILRGLINSSYSEKNIANIKIKELLTRLSIENIEINEIILALNPNIQGETTAMYLEQQIKKIKPSIKITRLARGLPMGSDLQYADEITLSSAMKNRL